MDLFSWHYSYGLKYYIQGWLHGVSWLSNYFAFKQLIKNLFSPWKRLIEIDTRPGFSIDRWFRTYTFNLISRGIGFGVRFTLIWVGLLFVVLAILGGAVGFVFWFILPFASLGLYEKFKHQPANVIAKLVKNATASKHNISESIFTSSPGKFVLSHVGITLDELKENTQDISGALRDFTGNSFKELVAFLLDNKAWPEEFFDQKGVIPSDLLNAASWWDAQETERNSLEPSKLGKPGLGIELIFGYTPTLSQYSVDYTKTQSFAHRLIGRESTVNRIVRSLSSGLSIAVVGEPGVGKKTVLYEFADRASRGELGEKLSFKRVLELDYNSLLSNTKDINSKKTKLAEILDEAAYAGNIILIVRDIQRLTNKDVEGIDFTDVFETHLEKGSLLLITVTSVAEYDRHVATNMRLKKFMEKIEVPPATPEHAFAILMQAAGRWEKEKGLLFTLPSLRKLLEESDKFITEIPYPEKVLELLDAVVIFAETNKITQVTNEVINTVLEEKLGVPFKSLSINEKDRLERIEEIIHTKLVNQEAAVSMIGKTLRSKVVGTVESSRPVGSFLFLGPTGVGKTETAKVLAELYFGSEENILRFDMAEFGGNEGLERLIGSVATKQPGNLTQTIRNKPASLLLLDELEKATPIVINIFLSLLDEGRMKDAFGKEVNGRSLFIIGTSNAAAEHIRQLVNQGTSGKDLQDKVLSYVLEQGIFSPEFLNRFDGVVVYEPLSQEHLVQIAQMMLVNLSLNLKKKNIYFEVTKEVAEKLATDGYDPAFGARPMRKIVDVEMGNIISKELLSGQLKPGDHFKLIPQEEASNYLVEKISF